MPSVIVYSNLETPAQVRRFLTSVDPTPYIGRTDAKIYDDTTTPTENSVKAFITGKILKYLKIVGDNVVDYTQGEKDAQDAAEAAAKTQAEQDAMRIGGPLYIDKRLMEAAVDRAIVLTTIDEINTIRQAMNQWITAFKAATAAATNLSNFQARVAALDFNLPDRTGAQARTSIKNKLSGGEADS